MVEPNLTGDVGSGVGFGHMFFVHCSRASVWLFIGLMLGVNTFILRKYWRTEASTNQDA